MKIWEYIIYNVFYCDKKASLKNAVTQNIGCLSSNSWLFEMTFCSSNVIFGVGKLIYYIYSKMSIIYVNLKLL